MVYGFNWQNVMLIQGVQNRSDLFCTPFAAEEGLFEFLCVLMEAISTTCLTPKNQQRAYVEFQFISMNYKVIVNHFSI